MANASSFTSGIAGRYATALFELVKDQGALDALSSDIDGLRTALEASDDLQGLIRSPVYSREEQRGAITALAERMGLSSLTRNTLGLMAAKRRLFVLPAMLDQLAALIAAHRGEITAEVTAAQPLSDAQSAALSQALKASYGKDVIVKTAIDPSLIGGLVVKVGSKMIDTSIRAKLNTLQNAMKEVG